MKWARRILVVLVALVIATLSMLGYLTRTESGTKTLVALTSRLLGESLTIERASGTLSRGLALHGVVYRTADGSVEVRLTDAWLNLELTALVQRRVSVSQLNARGLVVSLRPSSAPESPTSDVRLPIVIEVKRLEVTDGTLRQQDEEVFAVSRVTLGATLRDDRLILRAVDLASEHLAVTGTSEVAFNSPYVRNIAAEFQWKNEGTIAGAFAARTRASTDDEPIWQAKLTLHPFDPRLLAAEVPIQSVSAALEANGNLQRASVSGFVAFDGERIDLELGRLQRTQDAIDFDLRASTQRAIGRIQATGTLSSSHKPLTGAVRIAWTNVRVPARFTYSDIVTSGKATLAGSVDQATTSGELEGKFNERAGRIAWDASGSSRHIRLTALTLDHGNGRLSASGFIDRNSSMKWDLRAVATGFDTAMFLRDWPSSLNFDVATEGNFTEAGPDGSAKLTGLSGTFGKNPVSGEGAFEFRPKNRFKGTLVIRSGDAHASLSGAGTDTMNLVADIKVPSLSQWHPQTSGTASAQLQAHGKWPRLALEGTAEMSGLRSEFGSVSGAHLEVAVKDVTRPSGHIYVKAKGVGVNDYRLDTLDSTLTGGETDHTLTLDTSGPQFVLNLRGRGSYTRAKWSGSLTELKVKAQDVPELSLQAPTQIEIARAAMSMSQLCLAGADISLCAQGRQQASGASELVYDIQQLPLTLLSKLAALEKYIAVEGVLNGRGNVQRLSSGELKGEATLSSTSASVRYIDAQDAELEVRDLVLNTAFTGHRARGELSASIGNTGRLAASATIDQLQAADPTLAGSANMRIDDLASLSLFVPQLSELKGTAQLEAHASGTLNAPLFTAMLTVAGLEGEAPRFGLKFRQGGGSFELTRDGRPTLTAQIQSGTGTVRVTGEGDSLSSMKLRIVGKDLTAMDLPGAFVVVDPNLEVALDQREIVLTGTLGITRAQIDFDALTLQGGRKASADVNVVDREREAERRELPVRADIEVVVHDAVQLKGFGLDGKINGRLKIREAEGGDAVGSGELQVAGTYELYGRKMTIEQARLSFAGTALDDPQLDILAQRELPDAKISVRVTGTARNPKLAVTADEDMTQTEALSYLLTGKPPNELREEEGAMLKSAKDSLSTVVGDRLTRRVAGKFGIESVGVEQSAELGGSALTIGKYLSPRLFVSYGVALFEAGSVVSLRYKINERWSFEATQAPEDQHAGIEYRVER